MYKKEAYLGKEPFQQTNWRALVTQTNSGNKEAFDKFVEKVMPFIRLSSSKFNGYREEVFGSVLVKITSHIEKKGFDFDKKIFNRKKEEIHISDEQRIKRWISLITNNDFIEKKRQEQARLNAENKLKDKEENHYEVYPEQHAFSDLLSSIPEFREIFIKVLTVRERAVINLRNNSISDDEIAKMYNNTKTTIKDHISNAKKKIEFHLLSPYKLKLITTYAQQLGENYIAIKQAVYEGRIESVEFAGHKYVHPQWIKDYENRREILRDDLLQHGYISNIQLPQHIRKLLYSYRLRFPEKFLRPQSKKLWYIHKDDLKTILEEKMSNIQYEEFIFQRGNLRRA